MLMLQVLNSSSHLHGFTMLLKNTLAIQPNSYKAAPEPPCPKLPVAYQVSSRYMGKCAAHVLRLMTTRIFFNFF